MFKDMLGWCGQFLECSRLLSKLYHFHGMSNGLADPAEPTIPSSVDTWRGVSTIPEGEPATVSTAPTTEEIPGDLLRS